MRVYHILSSEHGLVALAMRRLKVARLADLNDPYEILASETTNKEALHLLAEAKRDLDGRIGLLCFSRSWWNPMLWSHYGQKHRGLCLGFDVCDEDAKLVQYSENRLHQTFRQGKTARELSPEFLDRLLVTKSSHWTYEDEVRLKVQLHESVSEHGLNFWPFSPDLELREVIRGAASEISVERLDQLVRTLTPGVRVIEAALAATRFAVIPHKRHKTEIHLPSLDYDAGVLEPCR